MASGSIARVLLDSALPQLDHLFEYRIPESLRACLRVGQRVRVPFRSATRNVAGFVVEIADTAEFSGELHEITECVSEVPYLTMPVWRLARTLADRAAGSAGDILRLAIPPRQARAEKSYLAAVGEPAAPRLPQQGSLWGGLWARERFAGVVESLAAQPCRFGLQAVPEPVRLATGEWVSHWAALFAEAAAGVLAAGKSSIVVVPDFRDLDQVLSACSALGLADSVIRVDARQSPAVRFRSFLRALEPAPAIIVGNRSAVYAPAHSLGAILLWDDGDESHVEPLSPGVHARDAALLRADLEGTSLVFASHARSVEVQRLIAIGWLEERVGQFARPAVRLSALTLSADDRPEVGALPGAAWQVARDALRRGPVLIQVAAPGYSPTLCCASCRVAARCAACAGPLRQRTAQAVAQCSWCAVAAVGWRCAVCAGAQLRHASRGATRTAEELQRAFPGVKVLVSDGETIRQSVDAQPALVIATRGAEPLAAGGYAAVVLLDAGRVLLRERLRASEDALRQWSNAVALAAPGAPCLLVGVTGPAPAALMHWQHARFAEQELRDRQLLRFPPAVRVATVTGPATEVADALALVSAVPGVDVLGPAPLPGVDEVRGVVRFAYGAGARVSAELRAALVAAAMRNRRSAAIPKRRGKQPGLLRVRFDDVGSLDATE